MQAMNVSTIDIVARNRSMMPIVEDLSPASDKCCRIGSRRYTTANISNLTMSQGYRKAEFISYWSLSV
jgi:hypothetical protein